MKRESLFFHLMLKQGIMWFTLAAGTQETVWITLQKLNIANFPDGFYSETWILISTKSKVPPQTAVIPCAMVMPKQSGEKCTWGPHCLIYIKEEEEGMDNWNGTIYKMLSTPNPMMSLTGTQNRTDWWENGTNRWNAWMKNMVWTTTPAQSLILTSSQSINMRHSYCKGANNVCLLQ